MNRLVVLLFENNAVWRSYTRYFLQTVEIKDHNDVISKQNIFDQLVKNYLKTYDKIRKIANCDGYDYTTGCLLNYPYFKENYKLIATHLSKHQALDADAKTNQQINFTGNLDIAGNARMFFITEEAKETILDFSQRNYFEFFKSFINFFFLIINDLLQHFKCKII